MNIDWINEHMGLSGAIDDYTYLEGKVDYVVNTRYECHDDIIELTKRGIGYFWIPIVDYFPPTSAQMATLVYLMRLYPEKRFLVHCTLGMGRSATLVLSYMINKYGYTVDEAISKLREIRPMVLPTDLQYEKLQKYYDRIKGL